MPESTTRSSYTKTYTHYLSALLSRSLHFIRILEASLYCYACITSAVHAMFPLALVNIRLTNAARILAQTSVQDNNEQGSTIEGQNDQHKIKPTQKGRRVKIENVNKFFEWHENYRVLICIEHCYTVQNVSSYLRVYHSGSVGEKRAIADFFRKCEIQEPKDVSLPPLLEAPFASLRKLSKAYICGKP